MRIGISTSVIQRGQTGIGQYLFALLRALLPYTDQHQFVLFVLEKDLPLFEFIGNKMKVVPVSDWYRPPLNNIFWHQRILPGLARIFRCEVLHVPSYRRLLWPHPCALVGTIHDLAPFRFAKKYDWMRMAYGRIVVPRLARRQDEIIAISRHTADDIVTFCGLPRERITIIHNGLDHEIFFPASRLEARASVAERYGVDERFFLYVARLEHPAKNHVRLITAFNQFKTMTGSPWQLVLVGSDWRGADVIHAILRQSPFMNDIHCLGFVPDAELPTLYRAAEVFVFPSLFEGFGMPTVEAMACGCPVLCSTQGPLGEVVGDAALALEPKDIHNMKNQLARIASDETLRDSLRTVGLEQARRFDWKKAAAATLQVYARAIQRLQPRLRTEYLESHFRR